MDVPPIQYTTTRDGISIAYTVSGEGRPFVRMPYPFNNLSRMWRQRTNLSFYRPLMERFRLVQYDSRGMGMSERDLSPDHVYEDYLLDLEAVIERLRLEQVILYGGPLSAHAAVRFAAEHPESVAALILHGINIDVAVGGLLNHVDAAMQSWDSFLFVIAQVSRRPGEQDDTDSTLDYYRETITQSDFLTMIRGGLHSNVVDVLPAIKCPTLVVNNPRMPGLEEQARRACSLIPDARMVLLDRAFAGDIYTTDGSVPPMIDVIDRFVADVLPEVPPNAVSAEAGLSPREVEVLRLLAAGKSNQQIAAELVISPNTVGRHVSNIFDKTGVANRAQAAVYARDHGIV